MLNLAVTSLRFRAPGFLASFIAAFMGATLVMAFASLLDTVRGANVDSSTEETLVTMATIVGGWGMIIVAVTVASTLTLSVRQRASEIGLLKGIGATPLQLGRMIVGEAAIVALLAALAAIVPSMLAGRLILELLQDSGQVAGGIDHRFGPAAVGLGLGIVFLGSAIAALVTARRATKMRVSESLLDASIDRARISRKQAVAGSLFCALGFALAVVTATVFHGQGIDAMQTAGQASIWFAIGLAILAPALIRMVAPRLASALERRAGPGGYLAAQNVRQRSRPMARALIPIILFTAIATATLYMQSIENAAAPAPGASISAAEADDIQTLNLVVVGMITVFAAIMLVNTVVAATIDRRREFAQQRLAGGTPSQVLRMVSAEGAILISTGALCGSIASLFTVLPYNVARTGTVLPDTTPAIYLGVVGIAATLTLLAGLGGAHRAMRGPAVEAVSACAVPSSEAERPPLPRPVPPRAADAIADRLRVLGQPVRVRIVDRLDLDGEQTVGGLATLLGGSLNNISQHLAVLRMAGLVSLRARGLVPARRRRSCPVRGGRSIPGFGGGASRPSDQPM